MFVVNRIQKGHYKKGRVVSDEGLSRRSKWAIYLAGIGIVPFIITTGDYKTRSDMADVQYLIQNDILDFRTWEIVPQKWFNESLYPREQVDILEADYRELGHWVDEIREEVHQNFRDLKPIIVDTSSAPTPKSLFSTEEVCVYRKSLLNAIVAYNEDVAKYLELHRQRDRLEGLMGFATVIAPFFLLLAIVLQLNVVFWEYYRNRAIKETDMH